MAKVELKQPVVQAIAEDVKDATSVVLVDYRGLTVAEVATPSFTRQASSSSSNF